MQQLVVANTILELGKTISVPLVFKISDVRDISKRSASRSQTIKIPGTEKNNQFFGGIYDFNSDFTVFNPNLKTPCSFSIDGEEFIRGFMQLKEVLVDEKGDISYDIVIYDSVADFWTKLGKKTIAQIDFTDLNHVYRKDDIVASWIHDWEDGYYYAMLFNTQFLIKTTDFKPAIFEKYLLDRIITDAGLTWSGNLKTNADFEQDLIQSEIGTPSLDPLIAATKTFRAEKTANETIDVNNNAQMFISTGDLPFAYDDEVTPPNDDSNNIWDTVNVMTANINGMYKLTYSDIDIQIETDYTPTIFIAAAQPDSAFIRFRLRAIIRDGGGNIQENIVTSVAGVQIVLPQGVAGVQLFEINNLTIFGGTLTSPTSGNQIHLEAGWSITWSIDISTFTLNFPKSIVDETRSIVLPGCDTQSEFLVYAYDDNVPLIFSDFLSTKFEQKQVILDVIARYNCFVYVNPEDENDIVFNIRDEFYAIGAVVDYTEKKDYNSRDKIKFIAELQSEEMLLSYTKGEDETNKEYTAAIADDNIYGQFEFNFSNEFVKGTKKITSPFSPTPLVAHGGVAGIVVPAIHSRMPIKKMRLLRKGGVIQVPFVQWNFSYRDLNGVPTITVFNGYPYAGHYDHPFNPTVDINFGGLPFPSLYYSPNQTTENNHFNRHWRNTMNQIADGDLVISKFNLNPADVYFIKNNPNTRIFVKNTFYYINKILFEGNEDLNKLTTIELITVEDTLEFGIPAPDPIPGTGDVANFFVFDPSPSSPDNRNEGDNNSNRFSGSGNIIGQGSEKNEITGDGNFIDQNKSGNIIVGDNNRIYGSNNTIIGNDGLTIRGDGITVINGKVTKGCLESVLFNVVDGGFDELRSADASCDPNKICSEIDDEVNLFNVSLFNLVNSENGITTEITDFLNQP